MSSHFSEDSTVTVTAKDVLPSFGLAFVVDENDTTWGITRSAEGPGLHTLERGARLQISLERHASFSLVCAYRHIS